MSSLPDPRRAAQSGPHCQKHLGRTYLTEESLAWFQRAAAAGVSLVSDNATPQRHVQCEVAERQRDPAVHIC